VYALFLVDILWMSFVVMFPNLFMSISYSFISNFMRVGFVPFSLFGGRGVSFMGRILGKKTRKYHAPLPSTFKPSSK
jgi:hypothetical protein